MGKRVQADYPYVRGEYTVTGIIEDVPVNSDFRFDFVTTTIHVERIRTAWTAWLQETSLNPVSNFVLLAEHAAPGDVEAAARAIVERHTDSPSRAEHTYFMQPLRRVHLYGLADYGLPPQTGGGHGIAQVRALVLVGVFILVIACVNFVNLATARGATRAREVGVRKVMGAHRLQLVYQFVGESVLLSFIALGRALGLTELVLPDFNAFTGKQLTLDWSRALVTGAIGLATLVGLIAGSYPAAFLSSYQPQRAVQGTANEGTPSLLRKGLVVFQFALSIGLIVATGVVSSQLDYIRNKDLGFTREQIVLMPIFWHDRTVPDGHQLMERFETVKEAFRQHPNVITTSTSGYLPGMAPQFRRFRVSGTGDVPWTFRTLTVDEDFFETYDIEMAVGRRFLKSIATDATDAMILNETAVKGMGLDDPLGRTVQQMPDQRKGVVVGVVKDFHIGSLHEKTQPLVMWVRRDFMYWLAARIRPEGVPETLGFFEAQWASFLPERPFSYQFLNDRYDRVYYQAETQLGQMVRIASGLAIFVACLGLFGLAAFTTQRRTKEIGIRKVLGASVGRIVSMLSMEFLMLVLIANGIAWLLAYAAMRDWLNGFAYHIGLQPWPFVLGGGLAVTIALLTVGYHSMRASMTDPVRALRYE